MNKELILLPSVTYAMKAKGILDQYKIRSYIQRTPKNTGVKSCGYCLFVPNRTDEAEQLIRSKGIRVSGRAKREEL
ncbi:MAG: DUF3343 domain-containing protein [Ruminococcus sp.]|uniref:DUF3343 domain-containing protein n=1 Tax=Ruminococcus sp. TaxID=41978 RepID=UPI002872AF3A|nr:DUF3343 domain-containing protein [Ruminococcus sp.]MBQ3284067.1 DUF3343 domain-containing protein [Ruminococcus sp.]